jgi:hypothetical protein
MSLMDQLKKLTEEEKQNIPEENTQPIIPSENNLDKKEITIILNLIKNTTFKGDSLETMYNLVLKLQNQFSNLK